MGMSRSRYGRYTHISAPQSYSENANEKLCTLLDTLKMRIQQQQFNQQSLQLAFLKSEIYEFYSKCLQLLTPSPQSSTSSSPSTGPSTSCSSSSNESILSNSNDIIYPNSISLVKINQQSPIPDSIIVFFCVLFDIPIGFLDNLKKEFEYFVGFLKEKVLKEIEFKDIIKIGLFIKLLRFMLIDDSGRDLIDDPHNKRITDLMRSEFALAKFGDDSESNNKPSQASCVINELCTMLKQILHYVDSIKI
jgi:hypothetical protein